MDLIANNVTLEGQAFIVASTSVINNTWWPIRTSNYAVTVTKGIRSPRSDFW